MVTAKNLQLLDTQGNNISPAVNIETLYYEETRNNTVYRNHIFKHFPVFVKYNGQPEVKHTGELFMNEQLYNDIQDYEATRWPENAPVAHMPLTGIIGNENEIYWTSDAVPYEYTDPNSGTDILVSGLTQNRLSKDNDFMRLDVSAYNLTNILEPYAYKHWVSANVDFLDTKIQNADIYNSQVMLDVLDNKKKHAAIRKSVGSIAAGTGISEINGHRYNEILDKMFFGPLNPELSVGTITISYPVEFKMDDTYLLAFNESYPDEYYYESDVNISSSGKSSLALSSIEYPGYTNWTNPTQRHNIIASYGIHPGKETGTAMSVIPSKKELKFVLQHINQIQEPKVIFMNFMPTALSSDAKTEIISKITNSLGEPYFASQTIFDNTRFTVKVKYTRQHPITGKPNETGEQLYTNIAPGTKQEFIDEMHIFWPIKFGESLQTYKLKTFWIHGNKKHKICAIWKPTQTFYVCIPKLIVCRMKNPIPYLNRIMQNGKWCTAAPWIITQVTTPVPDKTNGMDPSLAAYTVFKIQSQGTGSTKKIEFAINLCGTNLWPAPKSK